MSDFMFGAKGESGQGSTSRLMMAGLFVVLLCGGMTIADYFAGIASDAMFFAQTTFPQSQVLRLRIGDVSEVKLAKFWGFTQKGGFGNSRATLNLIIIGSRGTERNQVRLKQVNGNWMIVESSLPL